MSLEILKSLLTEGTTVYTDVRGTVKKAYVLAFVKDKANPGAIIILNSMLSRLMDDKDNFTEDGYLTRTIGMDRGFEFVNKIEQFLDENEHSINLMHSHAKLGWINNSCDFISPNENKIQELKEALRNILESGALIDVDLFDKAENALTL
ncbi:MAG: hypothetical protein JHC31_08390 [Sulfurihydrogenibium sp.]|jgi:hypothetical protein|nr:hypothetical protein [Sulfurihydrogenibium sp.]